MYNGLALGVLEVGPLLLVDGEKRALVLALLGECLRKLDSAELYGTYGVLLIF